MTPWLTTALALAALVAGVRSDAMTHDDIAITSTQMLFDAIGADEPAGVATALEEGADINAIGPGGQSPLMNAVLGGKEKSVQVLLDRGADPTVAEKDGYTPMHGAGFQGRAQIAKLLIAHGLDPSDRHADGFTPIHRACWGREPRHTATVSVLLKAGVDPEEPAADGKMPLQMAASVGTKKVLESHLEKKSKRKAEL